MGRHGAINVQGHVRGAQCSAEGLTREQADSVFSVYASMRVPPPGPWGGGDQHVDGPLPPIPAEATISERYRAAMIHAGHFVARVLDRPCASADEIRVAYGDIEFVTHTWGWNSVDATVQIDEVKAFIEEKRRGDEVLTLLVGDLNTPSTWQNYTRWIEGPPFAFVDTYVEANPGGFADPTMFGGEHRIDYILIRDESALAADPATYTSSLVFTGEPFDGTVLPVVSDHKGVATVFQLR